MIFYNRIFHSRIVICCLSIIILTLLASHVLDFLAQRDTKDRSLCEIPSTGLDSHVHDFPQQDIPQQDCHLLFTSRVEKLSCLTYCKLDRRPDFLAQRDTNDRGLSESLSTGLIMDLANLEICDINLFNEEENEIRIRAPKRYIRDKENPFEFFNEQEFKKKFRFSKNSVMFGILPLVEEGLTKINNRGLPISPVFQLLICLRFYATASFQLCLYVYKLHKITYNLFLQLVMGDVIQISQSTISRIIFRVSCSENKRLFKELGRGPGAIGFPSIDGAIDCTHIRLTHTSFRNVDEIYRNRKGYFSLNVQVVVGPRTEILDIVPEWPGSEHDSRIFQNSRIYMRYREYRLNGILVGDAGYPSLPFLLTPIGNPVTDEETSYNIIHRRTRGIVERTFGVWKRRFPCLSRGLSTKLLTSTTIVVACAVLHNLTLILNDNLEEEDDEGAENINDEVPVPQPHWQPGDGFVMRNALIERLFRVCHV
ncbi:putative nuclease HARBI1 [Monomorium pharaonis]|uniref:putative nuclease HARBI1 n=1 Tax=Monomorium pharaonis TaxID=307658 RepID=UPI0017463407|nr:putative nuclease HARBI1 [Monomorium pharaonis]